MKQITHPKNQIDVIEGTRESIEGYAQVHRLSIGDTASILILNELRCIHWGIDEILEKLSKSERIGELNKN